MIIYDWPAVLVANAETFRIDARSRSGGETIAGREQVVTSKLGRWVATLTVPLHTPAKIRAMRSLLPGSTAGPTRSASGPATAATATG
ncbi:hypothetical protein FFK22_026650 [Mycobacterium sp. KBS0706]|uniref:hypothetical protein n=1 Tax=Mycobacterium sp. KBS0706 TaxID=2578109 RepID=UPI00110FA894|nr:hypothetical protein [Mycobacterium sp. KBS0706]TSD85627.1 hypothetical protein FFK22_026650 [Mycobacterium sp. KBS0706]